MKYNIFGYLIGEGFSNVFKNKKSTGASLMIMCATMIIFGIFLILSANINHFVDEVKAEQGFQVFLKNDATDEEIKKAGEEIRKIEGVSNAEYKDKEYAYNFMREKLGYSAEGFGPEIYSTSYIVTLTDLNLSKQVQNKIMELDNIKRITSRDQTVTTLINLANGIKIVTGAILILLIFISMFIIANTIKLTVHARRKEISIMKYVGATNNFIRWPFIVEGMIIGIFASAISILIIGLLYNMIADNLVNSDIMRLINISLLPFGDMFNYILITYVGLGIGISAIGSIISMRKYLKV